MWTAKQSVQWEAERFKFIKGYLKYDVGLEFKRPIQPIQMENYAKLLVAAFSVLFNERLKRGGRVI